MSRVIRFRAWDADIKRMVAVEGNIALFSDGKVKLIKPTLTLMQFTGLLDKEGKEIYEGDIVRFYSFDIKKGKVVPFLEHQASDEVVSFEDCTYGEMSHQAAREIIGNEWENPDLL